MKRSINIFKQVAKACVDHLLSDPWKQLKLQQYGNADMHKYIHATRKRPFNTYATYTANNNWPYNPN